MPRTPDASSVTTYRRVNATITADPEKKSRTFVAPTKQGYLAATTRSTQESQSISRSQSVLRVPLWKTFDFKGRIFLK